MIMIGATIAPTFAPPPPSPPSSLLEPTVGDVSIGDIAVVVIIIIAVIIVVVVDGGGIMDFIVVVPTMVVEFVSEEFCDEVVDCGVSTVCETLVASDVVTNVFILVLTLGRNSTQKSNR